MTEIILNKVIIPRAGAGVTADGSDNQVCVIWDDFKAHSCPEVKNFCLSQYNMDVDIFMGVLTPVRQALDKVINKEFKGGFRVFYYQYMLVVQFLSSGNPKLPTRQILATWVVKDWCMVPVELLRNYLTACGYPPKDILGTTNETTSHLLERI